MENAFRTYRAGPRVANTAFRSLRFLPFANPAFIFGERQLRRRGQTCSSTEYPVPTPGAAPNRHLPSRERSQKRFIHRRTIDNQRRIAASLIAKQSLLHATRAHFGPQASRCRGYRTRYVVRTPAFSWQQEQRRTFPLHSRLHSDMF
jgi:hypothetical protein